MVSACHIVDFDIKIMEQDLDETIRCGVMSHSLFYIPFFPLLHGTRAKTFVL